MEKIIEQRDRVLKILSGKLDGFYLAGGTALSLFYFHHRQSYDLDFFSQEFPRRKIEEIISGLSSAMGAEIELESEQNHKDKALMLRYSLKTGAGKALKIDFIEDVYKLLKPLKTVDGVAVLSLEDIYLRKIFAACGSHERDDDAGRKVFIGGRQEAKDFFDLYFLSSTFMPLSKFAAANCPQAQIESIIVWYRRYDRLEMKAGLSDIITDKNIDYQTMDRHFRAEIEEIISREL